MKVMHEDLALDRVFIRRFTREAQTLAKLSHPNIVRFYGFEKEGRLAFMLMDYIEGETLKHFIHDADGKSMPYGQIRSITRAVCGALHYAHNQGLVHCDIKPANIMINQNGIVQLADFGIARMSDAATATMVGAGTPAYMAPEQVLGKDAIPQTDIYALGIVLYEMFTGGERPFTGEQAQTTGGTSEKVRWEQVHSPPPSPRQWNPSLSNKIEAVILRCLSKNPNERYGNSLELVNALELALGETQDEVPFILPKHKPSTKVKVPDRKTQNAQKKKTGLIAIGVSLLAIVLIGIGWLIGEGKEDNPVNPPPMNTFESQSTPISTNTVKTGTEIPKNSTDTNIFTATPQPTPSQTEVPPLGVGSTMISERDGMTMLYIPAGEFMMGGSADDAVSECLKYRDKCTRSWFTDEEPIHSVNLDSFWIDQTEVTNAMYAKFLNTEGNQVENGVIWLDGKGEHVLLRKKDEKWNPIGGYKNHPAIYVSWYGAQAYCEWAGRRLPTEQEWEKAASWNADKEIKNMYPWGNNYSCSQLNASEAGSCDSYTRTSPVGYFPNGASFYGAYDMAGNIREWTADWYHIYPGNRANASDTEKKQRIIRGGSWYNFEDLSRSSFRYLDYPSEASQNVGFRCVQTP